MTFSFSIERFCCGARRLCAAARDGGIVAVLKPKRIFMIGYAGLHCFAVCTISGGLLTVGDGVAGARHVQCSEIAGHLAD
jgi:hypothetical protein